MSTRFQRRHYVAIAAALREAYTCAAHGTTERAAHERAIGVRLAAHEIMRLLRADNERFDRDRFERAAGLHGLPKDLDSEPLPDYRDLVRTRSDSIGAREPHRAGRA